MRTKLKINGSVIPFCRKCSGQPLAYSKYLYWRHLLSTVTYLMVFFLATQWNRIVLINYQGFLQRDRMSHVKGGGKKERPSFSCSLVYFHHLAQHWELSRCGLSCSLINKWHVMLTTFPGDRVLSHVVQVEHKWQILSKTVFAANRFTTKEYKENRRNKYSLGALW